MSKPIVDKIPNFALTRKAKHGYITGIRRVKGSEPGELSQIKVLLADGTADFYPNHSAEEEATNNRRLRAHERKEVKDAIENKKAFENRAKISKSGTIIAGAGAATFGILFLLGLGTALIFDGAVSNLLISSNALAYLGIATVLSSMTTVLVGEENKKRQKTLREVEKYEMFLQNEQLIHEYQTKPVVLLNCSPAVKDNLKRVLQAEPLSIHNLHVLSYWALAKYIENIEDHMASGNPDYQYNGDTLGDYDEQEEGIFAGLKKLVLRKPKRQRRALR